MLLGDFNKDGKLDIAMVYGKNIRDIETNLFLSIWFQDNGEFRKSNTVNNVELKSPQPFVVDFYGTLDSNLLAYLAKNDSLSVFRYNPVTLDMSLEDAIFVDQKQICTISHPHSNAFVDLDGDCVADIFLTCIEKDSDKKSFQIWINQLEKGFVMKNSGILPDGVGQVGFADMDSDGTVDLVFPSCNNSKCSIHILYNNQLPLCSGSTSKNCKNAHDLCLADPQFSFSTMSKKVFLVNNRIMLKYHLKKSSKIKILF
jgi:integrin alpha FG-GAP repeat containing protein 1